VPARDTATAVDPGQLIAVLAPVLNRPERARPLADSLRSTSTARLVLLCSPGDRDEIAACRKVARHDSRIDVIVVGWQPGPGDYARKVNEGVRRTVEPWLLNAADDLLFHDGWDREALDVADRTGRRVIGTNDLCNRRVIRGRHSTHSLVHRSYIDEVGTVDRQGVMLHEGYRHNFCDDELVQTAIHRREFVMAARSHVQHLHPNCGHGDDDDTYRRGMEGFREDGRLARARRQVWRTRR
jgi:hypothetical protein